MSTAPAGGRRAGVLLPHFVREEAIALPRLALIRPLTMGEKLPVSTIAAATAMTTALHASTEEEVLYPPGLLIGELLRAHQ